MNVPRANRRPVRVAVVLDAVYPAHTGGKEARYYELLTRSAGADDMQLCVYTMDWFATGWAPWRSRSTVRDGVRYTALSPKLPLYHGRRRNIAQAVAFAAGCFRLLVAPLDVVEADNMPGPQLVSLRLVTWLRRRKLVVSWNEVWGRQGWVDYLGRAGLAAAWLERWCARHADVCVTIAPGTVDRLVGLGVDPARIHVVGAGADTDRMPDGDGPRDIDVLYSGRLIAHKRVDLLLDALALLRDQGTELSAAIVGDGPELAALQDQAERLGLGKVRFQAPFASRADVFEMMARSRVFVSPSEREGFGMTVIEAGLCGTPVVTSDHPDNESRTLIQPGVSGSVVPAGDVAAVASAIKEWAAAEVDRAALAAALAAGGQFDWDRIAGQWRQVLIAAATR